MAEYLSLARGRELFYGGGTSEREESLDDALYALRAYRTAWEHTEAEFTDTATKAMAA